MLWKLNAPSKESSAWWLVLKSRKTKVELMVMGKDMKAFDEFLNSFRPSFKLLLGVVERVTTWSELG